MRLRIRWKRLVWFAPLAAAALAPGWKGSLVPVDHDEILLRSARADASDVFGVSRPGEREGEEWHAQYIESGMANALEDLHLRGLAMKLVPPQYVAHIPTQTKIGGVTLPGLADAYFSVATSMHWPWWWPGGGLDLRRPR